jgi:hypothetical protein
MTVKDLLTGKEFTGDYPRTFDWSEIIDFIMTDATNAGEM